MQSEPQIPEPDRCSIDPDESAARAEVAHKHLGKLGRQQIALFLEAGELLVGAKNKLGHGKYELAFKRWRDEGLISFSSRSARRWMRLAKHAEAIKSAKLADLEEAENYVKALEAIGAENLPEDPVKATSQVTIDVAVGEIENRIVSALRKLSPEEGPQFLRKIIEVAKGRLEVLAQ
ncbi:MAG: hypothetical protein P4L99_25515 [Chthoniobacter sp.]|nr:hypothetical protein [Chthoniobacter sp.]